MDINEIEGHRIKIGKTSITVKDEYDKTRGIVRDIRKFSDLRPNIQMDYFKKLREAGVWGSSISSLMDCVIFDGNDLYYINNTRPLKFYEENLSGRGMESEDKRYNERLTISKNMSRFATVLNCEVL